MIDQKEMTTGEAEAWRAGYLAGMRSGLQEGISTARRHTAAHAIRRTSPDIHDSPQWLNGREDGQKCIGAWLQWLFAFYSKPDAAFDACFSADPNRRCPGCWCDKRLAPADPCADAEPGEPAIPLPPSPRG